MAALAPDVLTCPVHRDTGGRIDGTKPLRRDNRCMACVREALSAMVSLFGHERASEIYTTEPR